MLTLKKVFLELISILNYESKYVIAIQIFWGLTLSLIRLFISLSKQVSGTFVRNSCHANKSDPHHPSLNQIEQNFSVVNKAERSSGCVCPGHLVGGGGFRKAIVVPHYLYVSPLVVPKPSFFFDPSKLQGTTYFFIVNLPHELHSHDFLSRNKYICLDLRTYSGGKVTLLSFY